MDRCGQQGGANRGRPAGGGMGKDRAGGGEGTGGEGPAQAGRRGANTGEGSEGRCFFWVLLPFLGGGWSGVATGYLHSL
jgi:hypothetical protein